MLASILIVANLVVLKDLPHTAYSISSTTGSPNPGYLRAYFLDFNKAFDRIDHTIIIRKLIDLGVRRSIIPWICSFLTECVKLGQTVSNWLPVRAGVPLGTKLGPTIFVITINDLKLASPRCSYWKYVDDITISEFAAARGMSILQSELDNISTWAATNNMVLNPKKCKEMTLRFRRVVDHLPSALAIDTKALSQSMLIKYWALQSKVISNGICTLMRLWLRRQRGCICFVSSNAAEYHLPTYLRFILRSLGLSLNTVVLCGIMPSPSNYQIASSECRNGRCASSFLRCTTKRP